MTRQSSVDPNGGRPVRLTRQANRMSTEGEVRLGQRALQRISNSERTTEVSLMNTPRIDEIVRRLVESVPPGVRAVQKDLENNFRAVLRASLTKLDLVSRDEFDAQMRVLERTRARLEELEKRVAEMEGGRGAAPAGPAPGGAGGDAGPH